MFSQLPILREDQNAAHASSVIFINSFDLSPLFPLVMHAHSQLVIVQLIITTQKFQLSDGAMINFLNSNCPVLLLTTVFYTQVPLFLTNQLH